MEYQAHAFNKQLQKGRTSGVLTIDNGQINFRCAESEVAMFFDDAEFSLGGASDRLVFIKHPSHPDWNIYTSDLTILKDELLRQDERISKQLQKMKGRRFYNWSVLVILLLIIIGAPIAVFMNMHVLTNAAAKAVPAEWEQQLGESTFEQYKQEITLIEDESLNQQLQEFISPLIETADSERYQFEVYIADDSAVNAFALPGGFIVFNSGLVLKAEDADEVLGVLAHEMSHVTLQHGIRNIIATAGAFIIIQALIGDATGLLELIAGASPLLLSQKYSRDFESEADVEGYKLLKAANINPKGMLDFFSRIIEEEKELKEALAQGNEQLANLLETSLEFLSTHPTTESRIENIRALLENGSQDYIDLQEPFERIQQQLDSLVEHEEEQSDEEENL